MHTLKKRTISLILSGAELQHPVSLSMLKALISELDARGDVSWN